jgi:FMN hydrolase / 5-amino-6-(5-phospho-D-ribitylamino)uracil phosphatase
MPKRPIRAITFDLDDTLWDAGPVLKNAEQQAFTWLSEHAPDVTDRFTLEDLRKLRRQIYQNKPELAHQISQLRIDAMQEVLSKSGYAEQRAAELAKQAFDVFIQARNNVTLFDEVVPMLKKLREHYLLGTLTNGNADISKLPIFELFEFSFSAEQLNASKPSPELFVAAQQAADCEANEIIHVGDHIVHDVLGAHQAGCHALWFNPTAQPHPDQHLASMQVQSLTDIPRVIGDFEQSLALH